MVLTRIFFSAFTAETASAPMSKTSTRFIRFLLARYSLNVPSKDSSLFLFFAARLPPECPISTFLTTSTEVFARSFMVVFITGSKGNKESLSCKRNIAGPFFCARHDTSFDESVKSFVSLKTSPAHQTEENNQSAAKYSKLLFISSK